VPRLRRNLGDLWRLC